MVTIVIVIVLAFDLVIVAPPCSDPPPPDDADLAASLSSRSAATEAAGEASMNDTLAAQDSGGSAQNEGSEPPPSRGELIFAVIVCGLVMFLPVLIIEHGYESFTAEHGEAREGAAGATLALAVVLRTVSRTVLRTIVRTSARAGLKAGVKGAVQGAARVASRNVFSTLFKTAIEPPASPRDLSPSQLRRRNLRSLVGATGLLYVSWVIVVGFGQPFGALMTAEQAKVAKAAEAERIAEVHASRPRPEVEAWKLNQDIDALRARLKDKRVALKGARDVDLQNRLRVEVQSMNWDVADKQHDLTSLLIESGNRMNPPSQAKDPEADPTAVDDAIAWLFTRAPFPGPTPWTSPILWLGGVLFCLPLWFIYLAQSAAARREGVPLRHETGIDGGAIQLYFAGAFSYMPLSSDVIVDGTIEQRGRVSLVGLLAPTLVSIGLWITWKLTGLRWVLLASDAFLIYPMVQSFPLAPLDGANVYGWRKGVWALIFALVMGAFLFMGSEGLKNVI